MPCTAPVRGKTDQLIQWLDWIDNDPCGKPTLTMANGVDVSAQNLCQFHWEQRNGVIGVDPYQALILADGPIAYWRLNEVTGIQSNDYSGNGNHAYPVAPLATASIVRGSTGIDFGGGGYYNIADSNSLDVSTGSWEAWFRATTLNPTDFQYRTLFLKGNAFWFRVDRNPPPLQTLFMYLWDGAGYRGVNSGLGTPPTYIAPGQTYHAVCTFDGANIRLYLNGVLVGTANTGAFTIPAAATAMQIANLWDGAIDEIAIYNKVLTPDQILAHYRAGA